MKYFLIISFISLSLLSFYSVYRATKSEKQTNQVEEVMPTASFPSPTVSNNPIITAASPTPKPKSNSYFLKNEVIDEAASMNTSSSNIWWVSSGGQLRIQNGIAKTMWGNAPDSSYWRRVYESSNPTDTENGLHPQNIFRLVSKSQFQNYTQQVYLWIESSNLATSPQRNESNGIFFFNRYQDENNLYYTGLRVDGNLVLKKKNNGQYSTLAITRVYKGSYQIDSNPNLIPARKWIGLKSEVKNLESAVNIVIYIDLNNSGSWKKYIEFTDYGQSNRPPIVQTGSVGIRTDFMDAQFKNFEIQKL